MGWCSVENYWNRQVFFLHHMFATKMMSKSKWFQTTVHPMSDSIDDQFCFWYNSSSLIAAFLISLELTHFLIQQVWTKTDCSHAEAFDFYQVWFKFHKLDFSPLMMIFTAPVWFPWRLVPYWQSSSQSHRHSNELHQISLKISFIFRFQILRIDEKRSFV